jgi:class 3 adenylate cyclase
MSPERTERRLAAIMFTDIVGYTALMAESEQRGRRLRERHRELVRPLAGRYHGEVVDENGDELVLCFPSALDAVHCALVIQAELADDAELQLRIGIHSGDVVFEGERVYGDGVNVASRIRPLAEPGGVCISDEVQHSIRNQPDIDAVHSAVEIQRSLSVRNTDVPAERRMEFRIGAHLGDVRPEHDSIFGDGVNIAARLEPLADPGGTCISGTVLEQIRRKLELAAPRWPPLVGAPGLAQNGLPEAPCPKARPCPKER